MFLCGKCAPAFLYQPWSRGLCEMCGTDAMCADVPTHSLPYPLLKKEEKLPSFKCDRCKSTVQGNPSADGPRVVGVHNGLYDELCDSCRESLNKWRKGEAIPEVKQPENAVEWWCLNGYHKHRTTILSPSEAVRVLDALKSKGVSAWLITLEDK